MFFCFVFVITEEKVNIRIVNVIFKKSYPFLHFVSTFLDCCTEQEEKSGMFGDER